MRIIPVIDLLDETVIHAKSGEREKYEPVDSVLTDSANPLDIASKFEKLGFDELYIADLDAILNENKNNREIIRKISSDTSLDIILDAGFGNSKQVGPYVESGVEKVVLATETLVEFEEVKKTIEEHSMPVVGSIDMKGEKILANSLQGDLSFSRVLQDFENNGASELILLSLKKVGTSSGPDEKSLKKALRTVNLPIILGGGVRSVEDLKKIKKNGAVGGLVATALHNGSIKPNQVKKL
ncbi:hypothetical protein AKJ52_00235 [candidate division MSBL1 archaeon SCGC-AAA382C18]|uniref:HisA/hisF family protein n=1 Tax=candidate division MSBL1 archaeon SCGC-AAA382C18 TaxID=1698281 RepID=A0A133VLT4_9EURY|nr:hypothetical protein AKJ52_00235 [candidate division MSBL1 archaeon SCGC-AAA382C18]